MPSSLYVRRSQFENVRKESDELFRITNDGMRRMIDYFDREFPFPKNDFVLLPGFAFRAMEHAGATFFREDALIFRRQPTPIDRLNRSVLVLHELSHQWFGNLVTMRWFDDLWLKEGFANYIAFVALAAEQPEFVWKRFYQNFKPDALEVDISGGTTPLRQNLANLKNAKTAYGAIVYTKAPTVLRNLEFVLGEKDFRGGVRIFLKKHAYDSADWTNFVRAFEESSGKSLRRWANDYIRQRGAAFVKTRRHCDARNKIANLIVEQTDAPGAKIAPRTIKAQILLSYDDAPPKIISYLLETNRQTIREAAGEKCPAYVFANYADRGYAYFLLDAQSHKAIVERISRIDDAFLRSMLYGALWESVRAAEMPPRDFVKIALKNLPGEQDEDLARNLLEYAARAYERYLTAAQQKTLIAEFEELCRREMEREATEIGKRINYWRTFYSIAETPEARAFLKKLLSGETKIPGIELRAADRWRITARLLAIDDEQAEQILKSEKSRDSSDDARKQNYAAEAARLEAKSKRRYFEDYLSNASLPEDWIEASLENFNLPNQSHLTLPFLKRALSELPKLERTRKIFFVQSWLRAFVGGQQSERALTIVRQFLASPRLSENLRLKVLQMTDDLERTVRIRRKFGGKND